jgi:hypothetical protein
MIRLLALRNFALKPTRTLLLLFGYSVGVAVMIVLLSIGEALVTQAREERLVGGGDVSVLPEGIDLEVMKTGGLGGMFFSIDHARFLYRQMLAAQRLSRWIAAAAPRIDGKLLYLRTANGEELPVRASGEIPSLARAVGAGADVTTGAWADDSLDRRWRSPTDEELRHEIDHFHLPPAEARNDSSWGEWHYFNILSHDGRRWAHVSLMVGGRVLGRPDEWGGQVLVTLHEVGAPDRRFDTDVPSTGTRFSANRADVSIGASRVQVLSDGRYAVRARASAPGASVDVDFVLTPAPSLYFPGAALSSGETVSGYVVPALRADADGSICVRRLGDTDAASCERFTHAQAYHDHNWGVWQGVSWEWGAARAGPYTFLYGRIQTPDSSAARQPLFVFVADSLGFLAMFRPMDVGYHDDRVLRVGGDVIRTPSRAVLFDARGDDTLRITLDIEQASAHDTRQQSAERGDALAARRIARPYFVQMKGTARLTGRVRGRTIQGTGAGFFETYR